ncbi:MAG: gamma carbonic anhydrase family protein [Cyclobacteriaceae bacterium]
MALIKSVRGHSPKIGAECWLAENSTLVGEVTLGDQCTVWFGAVVRGDVNYIKVGNRTNIQDNVTIHGTFEKAPTNIGDNVSIGHNAIIHGCTLENNVLVGMGAMIMDGSIVKQGAIIAAGAVVLEGTIVEENSIYAGIPAKKVKDLDAKNKEMLTRISNNYIKYAQWFKDEENK